MVHRDLNNLYGPKYFDRIEQALDAVDRISPGLMLPLCDSFAPRNRDHHGWVARALDEYAPDFKTVTVLGSGVGLLFASRLKYTFPHIDLTMVDYNPWIQEINQLIDFDNEFKYVCADVIFDDITPLLGADLVINASCDSMWPMRELVQQMKTYCMLSTNMEYLIPNRNCVFEISEFIEQLQPDVVLHHDTFSIDHTDRMVIPNSKRFMVIGQSTQRG